MRPGKPPARPVVDVSPAGPSYPLRHPEIPLGGHPIRYTVTKREETHGTNEHGRTATALPGSGAEGTQTGQTKRQAVETALLELARALQRNE